MIFSYRQHVRVQVDVAGAGAGYRERESDHVCAIESPHDLAANFFGYDEHPKGHQFSVGKIPHFFLQGDAGPEFLETLTAADHNGIGGHAFSSAGRASSRTSARSSALACCQRDSSSSIRA